MQGEAASLAPGTASVPSATQGQPRAPPHPALQRLLQPSCLAACTRVMSYTQFSAHYQVIPDTFQGWRLWATLEEELSWATR